MIHLGVHYYMTDKEKEEFAEAQDEIYQRTEEAMGQFMFLLFIPNTQTRMVEVYIDQGEYHTWYAFEEFYQKIKDTCGKDEADRLSNACRELGVPFFYDRERKTLTEIKEKPQRDRLCVNKIKDLGGFGVIDNPYSGTEALYNGVKGQYLDLVNSIMNNEAKNG